MKKSILKSLVFILVLFVAIILLNASASLGKKLKGRGHKFKMLKKFKDEKEFQKEYPIIKEKPGPIRKVNNTIVFINKKGKKIKEMKIKEIKFEDIKFTEKDKEKFKKGKIIIKPLVEYKIIGKGYLLMEIHKKIRFRNVGDSSRCIIEKQIIYNYKGEKIIELPIYQSKYFIIISPNKKFFVLYSEGEMPNEKIYFYNILGKLLKVQKLSPPFYVYKPKYTLDSKYVKIIDRDNNFIYLYDSNGNLIIKRSYIDFVPIDKEIGFQDFYVSKNAKFILLSSTEKMRLIDKKGEIIWEKPSFSIFKCYFNIESTYIIIEMSEKKYFNSNTSTIVKLISLSTGETIASLNKGTTLKKIQENKIFVEEKGKIYEYEVE